MTDRELLQLAAQTLDPQHFLVWLQHNIQHIGRRKGAKLLGITEHAWRYRQQEAERIMSQTLAALQKDDAA